MLHRSRKLFDNLFCYIWSAKATTPTATCFRTWLRGERPHIIVDPGLLVGRDVRGLYSTP